MNDAYQPCQVVLSLVHAFLLLLVGPGTNARHAWKTIGCRLLLPKGQRNEFVVSPRKATGAPVTDVTAASAFAAEGSPYSFAGEHDQQMLYHPSRFVLCARGEQFCVQRAHSLVSSRG